jgi:hypothetical protein
VIVAWSSSFQVQGGVNYTVKSETKFTYSLSKRKKGGGAGRWAIFASMIQNEISHVEVTDIELYRFMRKSIL